MNTKRAEAVVKTTGAVTAVGALLWAVIRIILFCGDIHRTVEETAAAVAELKAKSAEHHDMLRDMRLEMRMRFDEAARPHDVFQRVRADPPPH
jgi:hypothetical protein